MTRETDRTFPGRWTALVVAAALALAGCGGDAGCDDFAFDSEAWLASSDDLDTEPGGDRHDVATLLVECRTLIGKSRAEVHRLLGRPDEGDESSELHYVAPDWLRLDDEVLVLIFGPDGRVVKTELVTS